ncbi:hypothetical protein HYY74_04435 [Candidatus Woesearchaeota archaeon]|nr:hypothetical protein [Candidatus Woesearchaeota archaeon]
MRITEIRAATILNRGSHADGGWFWMKYSAHPYAGCSYGCTYCIWREPELAFKTDGASFSRAITVKINAAELLDKELAEVPPDIIHTTDYQPIEARYRLSRKMLEVCLKHRFPVIIVAKSPLVLRDMDIIKKISDQTWACVAFSINNAISANYREYFEPNASSIESRFLAMQKMANEGIYTGTALLPVLPGVTDIDDNLKAIVEQTKAGGGKFVLAGGLVLGKKSKEAFFESLQKYNPVLINKYRQLYHNSHSPTDSSWAAIGNKVKQLCIKSGLGYRIKRYIADNELAENRRLAEELYMKAYELELECGDEAETRLLREQAGAIDGLQTATTR